MMVLRIRGRRLRVPVALAILLLALVGAAAGAGSHGSMVTTHADPPGLGLAGLSLADPVRTPIACATEGEPRGQLVYASPRIGPTVSGQPILGSGPAPGAGFDQILIAGLEKANTIVQESAAPFGVDVRLVFDCDVDGVPSVRYVEVSSGSLSFTALDAELRMNGVYASAAKLLVAYQGRLGCECGGMAWVGGDLGVVPLGETADAIAAPLYAVFLHEYAHTLGAVALDAPHSTGGWHCNDGPDVMCYADGGPTDRQRLRCPEERDQTRDLGAAVEQNHFFFDCNNDDYFHPLPPPGSWLEDHHNIGARTNPYIAWRQIVPG